MDDRAAKGYNDKKEFTCVCCGKVILLTKFASAKTARCDECKVAGKQPDPTIVTTVQTAPKSKPQAAGGDTKVCQCTKCGVDVTVTKFAAPSKVVCDSCKGVQVHTDNGVVPLRIDIGKLDRAALPSLDEYFILPSVIRNPRLRDVKCPGCGHEYMKIIKLLDGSDRGLVIHYQCPTCFTLISLSEQCDHLLSPQKPSDVFNYRGDQIESCVPTLLDTRMRNSLEILIGIIKANGISVDGINVPECTYRSKKVPTGYNDVVELTDDEKRIILQMCRQVEPDDVDAHIVVELQSKVGGTKW